MLITRQPVIPGKHSGLPISYRSATHPFGDCRIPPVRVTPGQDTRAEGRGLESFCVPPSRCHMAGGGGVALITRTGSRFRLIRTASIFKGYPLKTRPLCRLDCMLKRRACALGGRE